ncbi:putative ion transporter [Burkholderia multivorans CGD1]|nr:putative ion transporter [Burkholderia multivorans CGD1]
MAPWPSVYASHTKVRIGSPCAGRRLLFFVLPKKSNQKKGAVSTNGRTAR